MSNKTKQQWEAMNWNEKVADRVNSHHDRLEEIEKRLDRLTKDTPRRTVDDLAGNNRKIGYDIHGGTHDGTNDAT